MLRNAHVHRRAGLGFATLALLAACNKAGVDNAAPRLTNNIPAQSVGGGSQLSLDFASYVSDRETPAANLTYTVVSGGGTFTGTTYSNTFETLGTYTVTVRVVDPAGKRLDLSFEVDVTTANLGVMTTGNDLRLLDTDTLVTRPLANGGGFTVTYAGSLGHGCVAYGRQVGADQDLFLYDARTTRTVVLGDAIDALETFAGTVGGDRVLFFVQRGATKALKMYDARLGTARTIAEAEGESVTNVAASGTTALFFTWTVGGQGDIFRYDLTSNVTTAIAADALAEALDRVLPSGAILFTRRGGNGETDLFYWKSGVGTLEVGGDVGGIATLSKSVGFVNGQDVVMFQVQNGAQSDVYVWNPASGASVAVGVTGDDEVARGVLASGNFVFDVNAGGTDRNLLLFDVAAPAVRTFPASAVDDALVGVLSDSRMVVSKNTAGGVHLFLAAYAAGTVNEVTIINTNTQSFALAKVLANDKIVYHNSTTGGLGLYNPANAATFSAGANAQFVAEMPTVGDFVFKFDNGGQFDLVLWDETAATTVAVAGGATDEEQAVGVANGRIVFSRELPASNVRELFVWRESDQTITQITDDGVDHQVVATFAAAPQ